MMTYKVRTPELALAYITDCNLATVESMAMKKTRPKGEFERQISIAQTAINWMLQMGVDVSDTRAAKIVADYNGDVTEYIKEIMV